MSNVLNLLTFRRQQGVTLMMPREIKPKIVFRDGLWRVEKSRAINKNAINANNDALLFVVYKNQFEPGGVFGGQKEKAQ